MSRKQDIGVHALQQFIIANADNTPEFIIEDRTPYFLWHLSGIIIELSGEDYKLIQRTIHDYLPDEAAEKWGRMLEKVVST